MTCRVSIKLASSAASVIRYFLTPHLLRNVTFSKHYVTVATNKHKDFHLKYKKNMFYLFLHHKLTGQMTEVKHGFTASFYPPVNNRKHVTWQFYNVELSLQVKVPCGVLDLCQTSLNVNVSIKLHRTPSDYSGLIIQMLQTWKQDLQLNPFFLHTVCTNNYKTSRVP